MRRRKIWCLFAGFLLACGGGSEGGDRIGNSGLDAVAQETPEEGSPEAVLDGIGGTFADEGPDAGPDMALDPIEDDGTDTVDDNALDATPDGALDDAFNASSDITPDLHVDVPMCGGTTCNACQVCQGGQCVEQNVTAETEGAAETGQNDTYDQAEFIGFDQPVTGHIGAKGDLDWYRFCPPATGVVTLSVDFKESFAAMGLLSMMAPVYTESWLPSMVAIAQSNENKPACEDVGTAKSCATSMMVKFSVTPEVGAYTVRLAGAGDGVFYPGYDSEHPYTLRLTFEPGTTLEADQPDVDGQHVGEADTWKTAFPLTLDASGKATASSYIWTHLDIDWYRVTVQHNGWVRIFADVSALEDNSPNQYAIFLEGVLLRMTDAGPVDANASGLDFSVGDSPNCPYAWEEGTLLPKGEYYLRVMGMPAAKKAAYRVTMEFHPGDPEDDQPVVDAKFVGAAEYSVLAYDLGTLSSEPTAVSSYFWHYFDVDWFRFKTPAGDATGSIKVDLDFTAAYQALGWASSCQATPGLEVWMYLFQDGNMDFPGVAQGYEDHVPSQHITYSKFQPDTTYYLAIYSREGWDQEHPYTLTVKMVP